MKYIIYFIFFLSVSGHAQEDVTTFPREALERIPETSTELSRYSDDITRIARSRWPDLFKFTSEELAEGLKNVPVDPVLRFWEFHWRVDPLEPSTKIASCGTVRFQLKMAQMYFKELQQVSDRILALLGEPPSRSNEIQIENLMRLFEKRRADLLKIYPASLEDHDRTLHVRWDLRSRPFMRDLLRYKVLSQIGFIADGIYTPWGFFVNGAYLDLEERAHYRITLSAAQLCIPKFEITVEGDMSIGYVFAKDVMPPVPAEKKRAAFHATITEAMSPNLFEKDLFHGIKIPPFPK